MHTSPQIPPEVVVQEPEPHSTNTKLQYSPYESVTVTTVNHEIQVNSMTCSQENSSIIKPMTRWQQIVSILTFCVLGIVISVAIGGIYVWYYGVISGVGAHIVLYTIPRFIYTYWFEQYDQSRVVPSPVTETMANNPPE